MYYKDGYYWRKESPYSPFGYLTHGKGDVIFNTLYKIMQDGDYSQWAYYSLSECADMLMQRKRWPDRMNHPNDAKTRIGAWFSRILYEMGETISKKFRPQHILTRDPLIVLYAAAWKMNRWQLIEVVTVPWYLYRPTLWTWRKYIMSGDVRYLKRYRFWSRFSTSQKDYVVRLRAIKEDIINATLYKYQ